MAAAASVAAAAGAHSDVEDITDQQLEDMRSDFIDDVHSALFAKKNYLGTRWSNDATSLTLRFRDGDRSYPTLMLLPIVFDAGEGVAPGSVGTCCTAAEFALAMTNLHNKEAYRREARARGARIMSEKQRLWIKKKSKERQEQFYIDWETLDMEEETKKRAISRHALEEQRRIQREAANRAAIALAEEGRSQVGWEAHRSRFCSLTAAQLVTVVMKLGPAYTALANRVISTQITGSRLISMNQMEYTMHSKQQPNGLLWSALRYMRGELRLTNDELNKLVAALNAIPVEHVAAAAAVSRPPPPPIAPAAAAAAAPPHRYVPAAAAAASHVVAAASSPAVAAAPQALTEYPDGSLFVDGIADTYSCAVCCGVAFDPPNLDCGHLFCRSCLTDVSKTGSALCPTCRKAFTKDNLRSVNGFVNTLLCQMKVKCEHHEKGCAVVTTIGTNGRGILQHKAECKFVPQPCAKCKVVVDVGGQQQHDLEACCKRPIKCLFCAEMIPKDEMHEHVTNRRWNGQPVRCAHMQVCPYMCRGANRDLVQYHHTALSAHMRVCGAREVWCSFCQHGHPIKMADLRSHVTTLRLDSARWLDCAISLARPAIEPQAAPAVMPAAAAPAVAVAPAPAATAGQKRSRADMEEAKSDRGGEGAHSATTPTPSPQKPIWSPQKPPTLPPATMSARVIPFNVNGRVAAAAASSTFPSYAAAAASASTSRPLVGIAIAAAAGLAGADPVEMDLSSQDTPSDSLSQFRAGLTTGTAVDFSPKGVGAFTTGVVCMKAAFVCEVRCPTDGAVHRCFLADVFPAGTKQPRIEDDANDSPIPAHADDLPNAKRQKQQ